MYNWSLIKRLYRCKLYVLFAYMHNYAFTNDISIVLDADLVEFN